MFDLCTSSFTALTPTINRYLEKQDTKLCTKAKHTIKDCFIKHESGDPEFKCLFNSLRKHLRTTVGDLQWLKANRMFKAFLKHRQSRNTKEAATAKNNKL